MGDRTGQGWYEGLEGSPNTAKITHRPFFFFFLPPLHPFCEQRQHTHTCLMNGSFCPVCSAVKTPWSDSFCTQKQQTGIVCVRCQKLKNVSCLLNAHSFLKAKLCSFWLYMVFFLFFFYYSCKTVSIDLQSNIASSECFVLYSSTSVGYQRCEGCVCLLLLSRNLWIRALCLIVPYSNNTVESYKVLIDSTHHVKPNQSPKT